MAKRVLFIDKTAVLSASHERYARFATLPGWEVAVLSPRHWHEHMRDVQAEVTHSTDYEMFLGSTFWRGSYSRGFYLTGLKRALKSFRPDVIQLLEEPWSFFAGQTVKMARKVLPNCRILFYTWENIYREGTYCSRLDRFHRRIETQVFSECAAGVCATRLASRVLEKRGFSKPRPVIPYGIHEKFFLSERDIEARATKAVGDSPRIGYVGRLLPMKGIDTLISALPSLPGRLVILGSGEGEPELRRLADRLGLADRIEWEAAVPPGQVADRIRSLDALVLPSRTTPTWAEQLGRVMLEAMASGVPVVGSSSGSIPEVLAEEGWVFAEGDSESLAAALRGVFGEQESRASRVRAAWEKVRTRYTWERFVGDLAELYAELLAEGT
jgi:glycosyltransferase involved in cell wall biosynthesis